MKIIKITTLAMLLVFIVGNTATAQKRKKQKAKESQFTAVKAYEGPELPVEQVVRLLCDGTPKRYAYFIGVDETTISNQSLVTGPQEILVLPGDHKVQVRFVAKGEIAIPIEPFDNFTFTSGKSYRVKFEHTPGGGSYLESAGNTRIKLWIEEEGNPGVLMEKTVNGFGRSVK